MCGDGTTTAEHHNTVRLNNPVRPVAYNLSVRVDLDNWCFTAHESIEFAPNPAPVEGATVTLHADETLDITSVSGGTLVSRDTAAATVTFHLDGARLNLSFNGLISAEMKGLYRCTFRGHDGSTKRMASTHFEPLGARRFYVCLDEPSARATFTLTAHVPTALNYTVLSNSPEAPWSPTTMTDGWTEHRFKPIEHCPPYLTCLCLGDFEHIATSSARGIPIRFHTIRGQVNKARFGLEVAKYSLDLFESFFKSNYPLPKLDLVAVPDFPIGGMENWGCILLTETVLVEEGKSALASLRRTSELISHEVSHNWFGNLVGIDWWEGLWLKEGFASWCGNYATARFRPQWRVQDEVAKTIFSALQVDGTTATHAVEAPINDPADITQVFDAISYNKGMAVVEMLQQHLGPETFSQGIAAYVNKYAFANTTTSQLWESLEQTTGQPIMAVMERFTKASGHPSVSLQVSSDKSTALVTQRKYADLSATTEASDGPLWTVPLRFIGSAGQTHSAMLAAEAATVALPATFADSKYVKLNPQHTGFYRTVYDSASLRDVIANFASLDPIDQCGVQNDAFASFRAGCIDPADLIALIREIGKAESNAVLNDFSERFEELMNTLGPADPVLAKKLRDLCLVPFERIAAAEKDRETLPTDAEGKLLRRLAFKTIVEASLTEPEGHAHPVVAWCAEQGRKAILEGKAIDLELMEPALVAAVAAPGPDANKVFETLWGSLEKSAVDADTARSYAAALCSASAPEHFKVMIERVFEATVMRTQLGGTVFLQWSKSAHRAHLWPLFQSRFADVARLWGGGQFRIQNIITFVGDTITSDGADAKAFFTANDIPNGRLAAKRASDGVALRFLLRRKFAKAFQAALH